MIVNGWRNLFECVEGGWGRVNERGNRGVKKVSGGNGGGVIWWGRGGGFWLWGKCGIMFVWIVGMRMVWGNVVCDVVMEIEG